MLSLVSNKELAEKLSKLDNKELEYIKELVEEIYNNRQHKKSE